MDNGADIYTDVEMVRTGISKPALKIRGNEVHCLIKDENVAKMAKELGVTLSLIHIYNAVNQAKKEIGTRYDFRGSKAEISLEGRCV